MSLKIDSEFRGLVPPPTPEERASLEASLIEHGCREPITVWHEHDTVLDGHNRFEICTRRKIKYTTVALSFPDRDAAKAWIFENQIARRNLSPDQVLMLAAMRGVTTVRDTARRREMAAVLAAAGKGAPVLAGKLSLALAYGAHARAAGLAPVKPYTPRPPRGPSTKPAIPVGHELSGVSTLTGPNGELKGEWNKTRVVGADEPPTPVPETFLLKRASVMQRADGTTVIQWSSYEPEKQAQFEAIKAAVVEHAAEYVRPALSVEPPRSVDNDLLVCYPLGDPHVGMLAWANEVGEHFDLRIGERELCQCMRELVARAPNAAECVVTNLGDFWHAEDDAQRTPKSGHKLDVDGRSGKVGRVGLAILRSLIDTALTKHARVRFRSIPGNHDPHSSFWLPELMRATYANDSRVTVEDGFNPYQRDVFGANLLGWAHGDGAKLDALGEIMATDWPEDWGRTRFRYWNTGHVHHWSEKELRGCVVTTHRTLAGRDAWHHHSGYRSGRALKALAYHREWGLDSVAVVGVERVRAALGGGAP